MGGKHIKILDGCSCVLVIPIGDHVHGLLNLTLELRISFELQLIYVVQLLEVVR